MWVTQLPATDPDQDTLRPADTGEDAPQIGVVGCAVGAPFAVLVAEQLHASCAALVISITSAGQLAPLSEPPYFVLIDRAIRDEGTSTHYLPPERYSHLPAHLARALTARTTTWPAPADHRHPQNRGRDPTPSAPAHLAYLLVRSDPPTAPPRRAGPVPDVCRTCADSRLPDQDRRLGDRPAPAASDGVSIAKWR
jgi:hypothetical protein